MARAPPSGSGAELVFDAMLAGSQRKGRDALSSWCLGDGKEAKVEVPGGTPVANGGEPLNLAHESWSHC